MYDSEPYVMMTKISTEELAQSIYSLVTGILAIHSQNNPQPTWESLSLDKQHPWITVASRGPAKLDKCDGLPMKEAAFQMFHLQANAELSEAQKVWEEQLPWSYKLLWEAIARHIFTLMDADDASPAESELQYVRWFQRKAAELPEILLP